MRIALFAAVLATACGPSPRRSFEPPAPLQLTDEQSGQRFDLAVGQEAVVRLKSNPTTGYRWSLETRSAVLGVLGEPAFEPPAKPLPGAGGTEVWRLKSMTAGTATLVFEYRRPWEKGAPPVRSASFTFLSR
jgi:inhibitor of cysteine peptidase